MSSAKQYRELNPGESFYTVDVAAQYDQLRKNDRFWEWEDLVLAEKMADLKPGDWIIDCPFGTGRFANLYKTKLFKVVGVDISSDMLNEARKKVSLLGMSDSVKLVHSDLNSLDLGDSSYEALVCFRLLHLISPQDVLGHVKHLAAMPVDRIYLQLFSAYDLSSKRMLARLEKALLHPEVSAKSKFKYVARTLKTMLSQWIKTAKKVRNEKDGLVTYIHAKNTFCDVTYSHSLSDFMKIFEAQGFKELDRVELIDKTHAVQESAVQSTMMIVLGKH